MAFLQGDNTYRPRSKKEKQRLQAQHKQELEAKRKRKLDADAPSTFVPNYSYPRRNTHITITSGANHAVQTDAAKTKIEYTDEMLTREHAAQAEADRRKKCIAPVFNKGPYQYIATAEQAKFIGK
jgi:hypothetical protein